MYMVENDFRSDILSRLKTKYGADRVAVEPTLKGKNIHYPDMAVFISSEKQEPFLVIKESSLRTSHRARKDLKEVQQILDSTGASFGALVSPDVEFIFSGTGTSIQSFSNFPDDNQEDPTQTRPIQSRTELQFVMNRCLDAHNALREGPKHEGEVTDEFIESVHLLLESRRTDTNIHQLKDVYVSKLYSSIEKRHSWYQKEGEIDLSVLQVTSRFFNGYDLCRTDKSILEYFFEMYSENQIRGDFSTPLAIARSMVQLADVEQGDLVLDPAAGRGTILSIAAAKGGKGLGVEINPGILRLATFYVDLFNRDVNFVPGDFFSPSTGEKIDRKNFDQIIMDPPIGMNVEGNDVPFNKNKNTLKSEEAFLAKSLAYLKDGGTVTTAVPTGFLTNVRSTWLRELILDEFTLNSIIKMKDGPLYRHTSIDTAFISVTKNSAPLDHEINYEIVDSPENPVDGLREAVSRIVEGKAKSISQMEIEDSFDIQSIKSQQTLENKLRNRFDKLTTLGNVAKISTGNPPTDLTDEPTNNTITYLSISDIGEGDSRHGDRYILEDETRAIADESCVLLSTLGENTYTYIASEPIAPAQDLAVIRFNTPDEALVYESFLSSDIGQNQIASYKTGSRIPRINIRDLRRLKVPNFSNDAINKQAQEIREYRRRAEELEAKQREIENERESLREQADDFLLGGGFDE